MVVAFAAVAPETVTRLAAAYDRCLAAVDDDGRPDAFCLRFAAWLAERWRSGGPPEPRELPNAVNLDRHGVDQIRWYAGAAVVRGFVPGARGCYLIALDEPLPA
jgi:hypothetical protein